MEYCKKHDESQAYNHEGIWYCPECSREIPSASIEEITKAIQRIKNATKD